MNSFLNKNEYNEYDSSYRYTICSIEIKHLGDFLRDISLIP